MKFSYPSGSKPLAGYTLKRGIGIGGFGEVYFALSEAGKEVALKRIQRNLDVELRGVRQCLNLKHVNLISLWDIRTNEYGESWVVMEYVPGPSLRDVVESYPSGMPEEQVKTWFVSTASGVAYLHEHGIVHRDLKPGNIFCDEDEQVIKIGDYGLSKFISCSRRSGQTESVGTFHYMAPEIGKGVYGKEIDIYALGIILFEMLTGTVPFEGESTQEIIMKHLTTDPNLELAPVEFREVIGKSLRKDPELRYRNVPEMLSDIPWPEIAANSQKIVSQLSVGPLSPRWSGSRESRVSSFHEASPPAPEVKVLSSGAQLPPVIIDSKDIHIVQPDIVFGPLKDNSQAGNRNGAENSGNVPPRDPVRIVQQPSETALTTTGRPIEMGATAVLTNKEPIARAMQSGFANVSYWWTTANVSTPVKVLLLVILSVIVIKNSQWLLPLALGLALAYLIYYTGRTWFHDSGSEDEQKIAPLSKWEMKRHTIVQIRHWLASRPASDRATELLGSLLIGAFACFSLNLLGLAVSGSILDANIESWAVYAWLASTSIVACWSVLVISKFWEHQMETSSFKRLSMLAIGLVVGAVAFFAAGSFSIDLTDKTTFDFGSETTALFAIQGMPVLPAYLIFFAGLLGILRWWRQADPARSTRLSIVAVGVCLIWATVLSHLLELPLTPNCILAVVISVSVQLAAPWMHPAERQRVCAEVGSTSKSNQSLARYCRN